MRRGVDAPRLRSARADDAGVASIQSVILYPVLMLLIFSIVQGVIFFHAQNVAMAAANAAVQTVRVESGSQKAGHRVAATQLDMAGDRVLLGAEIHVSRGPDVAQVTITGQAPSIVPGISGLRVRQTATGPVEHVTNPGTP